MGLLLSFLMLVGSSCCQPHDSKQFSTKAGKVDADGFPISSATLCFSTGDCYSPPKHNPPFGLNPTSRLVSGGGNNYVLFTAEASAGGSGSLTAVALLRDLASGRVENAFPAISVTEQGEFKLIGDTGLDDMPILVTADYLWNMKDGETHFSAHQYRVKVYTFDDMQGTYVERVSYVTAKKYPSLDETDKIAVIENERAVWENKARHWPDKKKSK